MTTIHNGEENTPEMLSIGLTNRDLQELAYHIRIEAEALDTNLRFKRWSNPQDGKEDIAYHMVKILADLFQIRDAYKEGRK